MIRLLFIFFFSCTLLIYESESLFAAETAGPLQSSLKMLWGLAIVLALLFLVFFLSKRFLPSFQQQSSGIINIIDRRHITPKNALILVEIKGNEYLIGTNNDSISTIVPLKNTSDFSTILAESEHDILS